MGMIRRWVFEAGLLRGAVRVWRAGSVRRLAERAEKRVNSDHPAFFVALVGGRALRWPWRESVPVSIGRGTRLLDWAGRPREAKGSRRDEGRGIGTLSWTTDSPCSEVWRETARGARCACFSTFCLSLSRLFFCYFFSHLFPFLLMSGVLYT